MNFELIAGMVLSAFVAAGKPKAMELLQELHDKNEKDYKAVIFTANAVLAKLQTVTDRSETTLDDQAVAAAEDIIASSATANGVTI